MNESDRSLAGLPALKPPLLHRLAPYSWWVVIPAILAASIALGHYNATVRSNEDFAECMKNNLSYTDIAVETKEMFKLTDMEYCAEIYESSN